MEQEQLIPVEIICEQHEVEYQFISLLSTSGLIELTEQDGRAFVHPSQLGDLEKFICFHYDLDINVEGIEAICNLLERIRQLQYENEMLKRRTI